MSEDTVAFAEALTAMGSRVQRGADAWEVEGTGGDFFPGKTVWCADAGTAARFLPPVAALVPHMFFFDATEQLRRRPLGPLLTAIERLGAAVSPSGNSGLPVSISGVSRRSTEMCEIDLPSGSSSQFLSGLLMAAPLAGGLRLRSHDLVSRPYVDMTIALMTTFGVHVDEPEPGLFVVGDQPLRSPRRFEVEPDASTASYVFAGAALSGATVRVEGLGAGSLQGDLSFVEVLEKFGCTVYIGEDFTSVSGTGLPLKGGFTVDMGKISDTFMTAACVAPFADAPVRFTGIGHARLKESDRISAVTGNLRALGVRVEEGDSWLVVHPGQPRSGQVTCHRDHRIAMAFSVLGLRVKHGVQLDDPACVGKTFPGFFEEFGRLFEVSP